jgi:hypothetical protein
LFFLGDHLPHLGLHRAERTVTALMRVLEYFRSAIGITGSWFWSADLDHDLAAGDAPKKDN